jgi:hypothetical protein
MAQQQTTGAAAEDAAAKNPFTAAKVATSTEFSAFVHHPSCFLSASL